MSGNKKARQKKHPARDISASDSGYTTSHDMELSQPHGKPLASATGSGRLITSPTHEPTRQSAAVNITSGTYALHVVNV